MGEMAPFRVRRAPLLAGGVPYLIIRASSRAKRVPFRIRRVSSPARRRTYNFFEARIDLGLRYSANGDVNWAPLAQGRPAAPSGSVPGHLS